MRTTTRAAIVWAAVLAFLGSCGPKDSHMKLIVDKNDSKIISFRIQFQVGAKDDPPGQEGVSVLTAAMIAEGGSASMSYQEVKKALYPMAAVFRADADKEVTTFVGQCHADSLESFYRIVSGLILQPRMDSSDFKRNKENQISYLKNTLRNNNDESLGKWALQTEIYRNHPYGHVDEGTVASLERMTPEDVKSFYARHYARNRIVVGLAGDVSAAFTRKIEEDFARLPVSTEAKVALPAPAPIQDLEILIIKKEAIATAISMGYPVGINRSGDEFYPLFLANSYLGEHRTFNGVLQDRLREKRGMNYGNYSYVENFVQDGGTTFVLPNIPREQQYFSIWIRPVVHQNALFAIRCAIYELNKLVERGLTQEQFEMNRQFVINYSKLFVQTQTRRLGYAMDAHWYGTEPFQSKLEKELNTLTVEQVNAVIRKNLQARNLKIVVVTKDAEALRDALLSGKPSPIFYPSAKPAQDILDEDKIVENYPLNINKDKIRIVTTDQLF